MKRLTVLACLLVYMMIASGCSRQHSSPSSAAKPVVVTTLFPVYDFTRSIVGNRMEVQLLLPPGSEPHHYEPRPEDLIRIERAALFVSTNSAMEPWVGRMLAGMEHKRAQSLEAAAKVRLREITHHEDHDDGHRKGSHRQDPHVWLDFTNAQLMVDEIAQGVTAVDPANGAYYRSNAATLKAQLATLDQRFKDGLAACRSRVLLHGGHYAFGYLAQRYGLTYRAALGVTGDAEPSPRQMLALVRQIRENGVKAVYSEELVSPRLAQALAAETNARVLRLHGGHNLAKDELARGTTFVNLMEQNLQSLRQGLECQ